MARANRNLLSTKTLNLELAELIFGRAETHKRLRGLVSTHEKLLAGQVMANLFWESSTRTRVSFELAARRLGAYVINLHPKDSSLTKGV